MTKSFKNVCCKGKNLHPSGANSVLEKLTLTGKVAKNESIDFKTILLSDASSEDTDMLDNIFFEEEDWGVGTVFLW